MKFVLYARYIPDRDKVAAIRPAHRDYIASLFAQGRIAAAGPFADGSGGLFIYEAASPEEAAAMMAQDPYFVQGAYGSFELTAWTPANANPELFRLWPDGG
ncbi:MAG: YciI family protein [Verrucomicrobiota bacterium]